MELAIALLALTTMEIVLGIDNIVFITIASSKLPLEQQPLARRLGLGLALITRLMLLLVLSFFVQGDQFQEPVFSLTDLGVPVSLVQRLSSGEDPEHSHLPAEILEEINSEHFDESNGISVKDLILFLGGLFLVGKSVHEMHDSFSHEVEHAPVKSSKMFASVLMQIAFLDIVFSLDSVITAVGMVEEVWVMVVSIILAVGVMLAFAEPVSKFVEDHPTVKVLALSFMILIGVMLVAEGVGAHIDKGYIYFAMFFALIVEMINIRLRSKTQLTEKSVEPV